MQPKEYSNHVRDTKRKGISMHKQSKIAILGILGELGSISTLMKKKYRDEKKITEIKEKIINELGDILWYSFLLAQENECDYIPNEWPCSKTMEKKSNKFLASDVIDLAKKSKKYIKISNEFIYLNKSKNVSFENFLKSIDKIAKKLDCCIMKVAEINFKKTKGMWSDKKDTPSRRFDEHCPGHEKLPRVFEINFKSINGGKQALITMSGVHIGDVLDDNSDSFDGYKFHDAFHIVASTMLGWSPVLRRMLRRKRKSSPYIDKYEDGARAAIVEEAVINYIFRYLEEQGCINKEEKKIIDRCDSEILHTIKDLVQGLEVEKCEDWEWNDFIKTSANIFNKLVENSGGTLHCNADKRKVNFEKSG